MAYKSPPEVAKASIGIGVKKTELSIDKMLILGFLAGAYIAFGGLLAIRCSAGVAPTALAKFVAGAVFPVGLMLVIMGGSELFTGNCYLPTVACLAGKGKISGLLKNWVFVYIGNFIGSLFVAYFLAYLTGLVGTGAWLESTKKIAEAKVGLSWGQAFFRGIGANWLVCLAVWLAVASDSVIGKIWACWFPIMAFVAMGFEHSIANMFFIPAGIFYGATVTWGQFFVNNLIPVTIGNIIGGAFFVATIYWYLYIKGTNIDES